MKSPKLFKSTLVLVLSLMFAPIVSMASVGTVLDADTSLNSNANTGSSSIDAGVNVNLGATSSSSSSTNSMTTEGDSDLALKLNTSGVAVRNSSQVSSNDDLDIFSTNVTMEKEKVDEVRINSSGNDETKVAVVYKHKGKLFGFIPVTIKSTTAVMAKANADTAVESHLSWWSFLVTGENYNRKDIETEIRNNAIIMENAKADASASAKARVAEAIISEVDAYASAKAVATSK